MCAPVRRVTGDNVYGKGVTYGARTAITTLDRRGRGLSRASPRPRVSPLTLGWIFLHIGTIAYGGLGTTLALIERELVRKRGLLTAAEVTEALTYTKLLPGSTGPQAIAYLGYKLGGWSGSALAMAAFIFPSALLMVLLAGAYVATTTLPVIGPW